MRLLEVSTFQAHRTALQPQKYSVSVCFSHFFEFVPRVTPLQIELEN